MSLDPTQPTDPYYLTHMLLQSQNISQQDRLLLDFYNRSLPWIQRHAENPALTMDNENAVAAYDYLKKNEDRLRSFGVLTPDIEKSYMGLGNLVEMRRTSGNFAKNLPGAIKSEQGGLSRGVNKAYMTAREGTKSNLQASGMLKGGRGQKALEEMKASKNIGLEEQQNKIAQEMTNLSSDLTNQYRRGLLGMQGQNVDYGQRMQNIREDSDLYRRNVINQGLGYVGQAAGTYLGSQKPRDYGINNGTAPNSLSLAGNSFEKATTTASERDPGSEAILKRAKMGAR